MEWLDIVDERDFLIGQRTRGEVHRQQLLHRAAHILVFNRDGELLLQKRSLTKEDSPGLWDSSAAGHLSAGESYFAAARRELQEELGVAPTSNLESLFKLQASPDTECEFAWVYRCQHEGPFECDELEIDELRWFSLAEISAWIGSQPTDFSPSFQLIWNRLHSTSHGSEQCRR